VTSEFIQHVRHNWPLALALAGLLFYLPIVLVSGIFFTNQGRVLRSREPRRYWRWVALMSGLFLACLGVLVGSYYLSGA
jgi:threonine/homoserine/homoserine lactone efflux protein